SVELRFLKHANKLELLDTTFPHEKPEVLYWQIDSKHDGEATVEISYFTSGIKWVADYVAIANSDETELQLESFVRVTNHSGENYENAQVRLVVGTINLVQAIANLAKGGMRDNQPPPAPTLQMAKRAIRSEMRRQDLPAASAPLKYEAAKPKAVAKESLSEYYIYTIEGTETIPHQWSKRLKSFMVEDVPIKIEYRYRQREYGDQLVRLYLSTNNKPSRLGTTPLPEGQIRIFRRQAQGVGNHSYLVERALKYTPIGDKIELNLGEDPKVAFELIPLKVFREDIWMRLSGADVYRRANDGRMKVDVNSHVAGWNEHTIYTQRIRNYSAQPIKVEVRRAYSGDIVFRSQLQPKLHDFQTVQYETLVPAGEQIDLYQEVIRRDGRNNKKNNIELATGKVSL
ncbi:MAG: hypothetical protein AAF512_23220, partial [Pseudomonadota bacterium]